MKPRPHKICPGAASVVSKNVFRTNPLLVTLKHDQCEKLGGGLSLPPRECSLAQLHSIGLRGYRECFAETAATVPEISCSQIGRWTRTNTSRQTDRSENIVLAMSFGLAETFQVRIPTSSYQESERKTG